MAFTQNQDTVNRVKNTLDLANKPGWNTSVHATGTQTISQSGTVASPYYADGRQVPAAKTYS